MDDSGFASESDSASAFRDFIERELSDLDHDNIWSVIPPDVVEAAWACYLHRLDRQVQVLAAQPYADVWEEQLSDEQRAIVEAMARHFSPAALPQVRIDPDDWHALLCFFAVLTLHIDDNRRPVLEPADLFPYLDLLTPPDESEDDERPVLPPWLGTQPVPAPVTRRGRRFDWADLLLVFAVSGLLWISITEALLRHGA